MTFRELIRQVRQDWVAHGKDWTKPGFRAVAVHRFGNWRMQINNKLIRAPFSIIYRVLYRRVRNVYGIELPFTVQLGENVIIEHQSGIVVHGETKIGDRCIIRQGVTIGIRNLTDLNAAPTLGQNVNIGAGAVIVGAITIGDNVDIGANSVVLQDIPAGALVVGIPGKIKQR